MVSSSLTRKQEPGKKTGSSASGAGETGQLHVNQ